MIGLPYGSTISTGRHLAGQGYRGGAAGESIGGRPWCGVARRDGTVARARRSAGLSEQLTAALADTYKGPWAYAPGAVFTDLAAAVADGADCPPALGKPAQPGRHGTVQTHPKPKIATTERFS